MEKRVIEHFGRLKNKKAGLNGLKIMDIGCGGGLLAEAMAERGAKVTGLDPSEASIKVARSHAVSRGLRIDYMVGTVEDMDAGKEGFDIVMAMEVIEHVAEAHAFLGALAGLLKPKGMLVVATLNRTWRSYLFGVLAAEYVLDWVPRGTHAWSKFQRPSELAAAMEASGFKIADIRGVVFDPLEGVFRLDAHRLGVNYMMTAIKA